jgi:hypothetical protein
MTSHVIGWVCIGLAAALVACIWPFRRGFLGVALNVTSAVVGAVAAPVLGLVLGLPSSDPRGLALAAVGALALLAVVHVSWTRPRPARHRERHG